jgi:hypothetical protein
LDYFGARYMSSAQGRFTSPDPGPYKLGNPQTFNRYSYVNNNPLKYIDPNGKEPVKAQAATAEEFARVMDNSPSHIGRDVGPAAAAALLSLGDSEIAWKGLLPKTQPTVTPYFNQKKGRYVYTTDGGWIDMVHFLFYAGKAYSNKINGKNDPVGKAVQAGYLQEAMDSKRSAYSYEDLPSDRYGALFAVNYFDPNSELSISEQILNYLNDELGATDPKDALNYSTIPDKDTGQPPTEQNKTTDPKYTKERENGGY